MTPFMNADFLLKTETAKQLYHQHAEVMPIIDYHCHINPQEIYEDKRYGWVAIITSGGRCVPAVCRNIISRETLRLQRNFKSGRRQCPILSVIPCIIGPIWSCSVISMSMSP